MQGAEGVGAWMFRNRGWLPVPLLVAMVASPLTFPAAGFAVVCAGEALRLWAVGHIGLPSRTRGDGAHRVVDSGPYALVRNPLYVGNILIFGGLGVMTWPWALVAAPLLALEYHFIVAWEESNLRAKLGQEYADYCARVRRWVPSVGADLRGAWDARQALRSERSTLLALAVIFGVMAVATRWTGAL